MVTKFIQKYIYLIIVSLFIIIVFCFCVFAQNVKIKNNKTINNEKLYSFWEANNKLTFINKDGETVIEFPANKFNYTGNLFEDKIFLAKKIKFIKSEAAFDYILVKLYIMDKQGKIIKKIPYNSLIGISVNYGEDLIPEFHNGKAIINLQNNYSLIVDYNGEIISKQKTSDINDEEFNINADYVNSNKQRIENMMFIAPSKKHKMDEKGPFPYYVNKGIAGCKCETGCINYVNKNNKTLIKLNTCAPFGSGDYTRDPYFYNGVAMVMDESPNPTRRFINNKGEYINNETYVDAFPFWEELSPVVSQDGSIGYINTKGKWVKKSYVKR